MFKAVQIKDILFIDPKYFSEKHLDTIKNIISLKFINKIIKGEGLCICIKTIDEIGSPFIIKGTGREQVSVVFTLVVFLPNVGEILVGRLDYSDSTGLLVNLGFTKNILIEADQMPFPSYFNRTEGVWEWKYKSNSLYLDAGEEIRLRVISVEYGQSDEFKMDKSHLLSDYIPSLLVKGTLKDTGLGLVSWWEQ